MATKYKVIRDLLFSLGLISNNKLTKSPGWVANKVSTELGSQVSRYHICQLCKAYNITIATMTDQISEYVAIHDLLVLHTTDKGESCYKLTINDKILANLMTTEIGETVSMQQINYWRRCNNIMASHNNHGGKRPSKLKSIDDDSEAEAGYEDVIANLNPSIRADRAAIEHYRMLWFAPVLNICSSDILMRNHILDTRRLSADRGHVSYNDKLAVPS